MNNIVISILMIIFVIPCLIFAFLFRKEQREMTAYFLLAALIIEAVGLKLIGG